MLRRFVCLSLLLTAFASPLTAAEVNKPAPAFTAQDIAGQSQSLAQYKGKIVVLEWSNPECPFVRKHYGAGAMQALQQYALKKGVVWLTVNSSAPGKEGNLSPAEAKSVLVKTRAHETAYILDADGKLGALYGAKATPHMFVVAPDGTLVYAGAIDDQPTPDPSDIKSAHNYVRAAIDALLAGKPVPAPQSTRAYGCSVKYRD